VCFKTRDVDSSFSQHVGQRLHGWPNQSFLLVNRSKDGFAAKGGQACVGCSGETSPLLIRGCLAELPCQNQWWPAALHAAPALIQYITKLRV
jgi:hypothetical protein